MDVDPSSTRAPVGDGPRVAVATATEMRRGAASVSEHRQANRQRPNINSSSIASRARYASWYEMFPRSAGKRAGPIGAHSPTPRRDCRTSPTWASTSSTSRRSTRSAPLNKKGANNSLVSTPDDPGVPYAIGSAAGGHDAIEPQLGTIDDFDHLVAAAGDWDGNRARYCVPGVARPSVGARHPDWFTIRPDGSIKFAENPPKKYEDIYPINFESARLASASGSSCSGLSASGWTMA